MAAPPNPQSPPPPPSYLPPTYPAQGYPQQYPPSSAPRSHAGLIIAVVVVIVVVVVLAAGLYVADSSLKPSAGGGGSTPAQVTVSAIDWSIQYTGTTSGYFGPAQQSSSAGLTQIAGSQIVDTVTFGSSAVLFSHNINQITVTAPFSLVSISPSLPLSVSPGGSVSIAVTIQLPSTAGTYAASGTIYTN